MNSQIKVVVFFIFISCIGSLRAQFAITGDQAPCPGSSRDYQFNVTPGCELFDEIITWTIDPPSAGTMIVGGTPRLKTILWSNDCFNAEIRVRHEFRCKRWDATREVFVPGPTQVLMFSDPPFHVHSICDPAPTISGPTCVCAGQTYTYTATSSLPNPNFQWSSPGASIVANGNTAQVTFGTQPTTVTVSTMGDCIPSESATINALVGATPVISNIAVNVPDCPLEFGTASIGSFLSMPCIDHVDWEVESGPGGVFGNNINAIFTITGSGMIKLCATAVNECGISSTKKCVWVNANTDDCDGGFKLAPSGKPSEQESLISDEEFDNEVSVTPNPTSGLVDVTLKYPEIVNQISIVDVSGRIVRNDIAPASSIKLDLQDVTSGHYYLVIRTHQFTVVRSIEVTR